MPVRVRTLLWPSTLEFPPKTSLHDIAAVFEPAELSGHPGGADAKLQREKRGSRSWRGFDGLHKSCAKIPPRAAAFRSFECAERTTDGHLFRLDVVESAPKVGDQAR